MAQMAMKELGFSEESLERQLSLFNFDENAILDFTEDDLRLIWGDYWERQDEFYRGCQGFAGKLDWREIENWL